MKRRRLDSTMRTVMQLPTDIERTTTVSYAAILLVFAVLGGACVDSENRGRFEVDGVEKYRNCLESAFPFEPTFFSARERIDSAGLIMQSDARLGTDADRLHLEVYATERAKDPDSPVEVVFPSRDSSRARADLELQETCPRTNISLAIEGTARFDEFSAGRRGRVVGRLTEGAVIDARTGEEVASSLSGEWAFDVRGDGSWPTYDAAYPVNP